MKITNHQKPPVTPCERDGLGNPAEFIDPKMSRSTVRIEATISGEKKEVQYFEAEVPPSIRPDIIIAADLVKHNPANILTYKRIEGETVPTSCRVTQDATGRIVVEPTHVSSKTSFIIRVAKK
jgi:hypothetical protein